MTDALCGSNIIHDLGYLESGLTGSLVQLVICDEILGWISHFVRGVDVGDVALALDLIDEIGPDGNFLESDHTFEHFRERWYPKLFERDNFEGWLAKGGQTLAERAAARVEIILADHQPDPLPEETIQQLEAIIQRAEEVHVSTA
jgi:trimethylamine--corrinoid protein Co-methyltransferase